MIKYMLGTLCPIVRKRFLPVVVGKHAVSYVAFYREPFAGPGHKRVLRYSGAYLRHRARIARIKQVSAPELTVVNLIIEIFLASHHQSETTIF